MSKKGFDREVMDAADKVTGEDLDWNLKYHLLWLFRATRKMENAEKPDIEQIRRNLETMSHVFCVVDDRSEWAADYLGMD